LGLILGVVKKKFSKSLSFNYTDLQAVVAMNVGSFFTQRKLVQAVTLPAGIQEVPGSNRSRDTN
jgi:hypothetical protein